MKGYDWVADNLRGYLEWIASYTRPVLTKWKDPRLAVTL
jgi:hypothetical protein